MVLNQLAYDIDNCGAIHDHIILHRSGGELADAGIDQLPAVSIHGGFNHFYRTRSNIEGDESIVLAERAEKSEIDAFPRCGHGYLLKTLRFSLVFNPKANTILR